MSAAAAEPPYSPLVLEHFQRPRNAGRLDPDDPRVGTGMIRAPQGDVALRLQVQLEGEAIARAAFKTFGCGSAIATTSLATEWLIGRTPAEARAITCASLVEALSLPPGKIHCAVLVVDAIEAAIHDALQKRALGFPSTDTDRAAPPAP